MKVKVQHITPLWVCSNAIRTCWNSFDKSDSKWEYICPVCTFVLTDEEVVNEYCEVCGYETNPIKKKFVIGSKDKELIDRVGNKYKHSSTLEHIVVNFHIKGISRACLQEVVRHRIGSFSVKSTRYTLKELKKENIKWFDEDGRVTDEAYEVVKKYCVIPDVKEPSDYIILDSLGYSLGNIVYLLNKGVSNDKVKYLLPEAYKTELTWTINFRSLQNFLSLRTDKSALWEIRELAYKMYEVIPEEYKYLLKPYVKEYDNANN